MELDTWYWVPWHCAYEKTHEAEANITGRTPGRPAEVTVIQAFVRMHKLPTLIP